MGHDSVSEFGGASVPVPVPAAALPREGATRLRVRYGECDPMQVAHHAAYLPWLELARTDLLRAGGVSYAALEAAGVLLVIVRAEVRYRRPARYDDVLEVGVRVVGGSRVKIEHEYEVRVVEREVIGGAGVEPLPLVIATGTTTLACVGRDGRPRELPAWLVVGRDEAGRDAGAVARSSLPGG